MIPIDKGAVVEVDDAEKVPLLVYVGQLMKANSKVQELPSRIIYQNQTIVQSLQLLEGFSQYPNHKLYNN